MTLGVPSPVRLTRRTLLRSGAAALPLGALPLFAGAQAYATQVSLLLDGIGSGLDPDLLGQVVAPFLAAGLPVTCVADLAALTAEGASSGPLCDLLATLALREPGLFDLALPIGRIARTERYFQLRRAGELRGAVLRAFENGPAAGRPFPVVTLVDRGENPNIDHTAFRGAGFRVHLKAADGPWLHGPAGRGELVGSGGLWLGLDAEGLGARVSEELRKGRDTLLALSLDGFGDVPTTELVAQAADLADRLAGMVGKGAIIMASPAQLRLYAGVPLPVDVALLVEPGATPEASEAALAFVRQLAGQGVPLTLTGRAEAFGDLPGTVHFCVPASAVGSLPLPLPACQRTEMQASEAQDLTIQTDVNVAAAAWPEQGIDADGRLKLAPRLLSGESPDRVLGLSPLEDHVIEISASDLVLPVQRAQLVRRFVEAGRSGQAYFHTVPGLASHLVETEPVLARLWSVRRRRVTDPRRDPAPKAAERDRLIDDARLAWTYIDRFTNADTGQCAGTVQSGKGLVINHDATMWDLASQLHAIRVASQLAFIDRDEARERTETLIRNLPTAEIEGFRLPPAMFRTDDGSISSRGFDICDTGRFLIALTATVGAGLLQDTLARAVVGGWDLAAALPDGRPRSHLSGRWIDTTLSHCTPYIRRGMEPWGFSLVSPHPGLTAGTDADRKIALLYDVAAIGPVGVEPVLLDLIELGPDPEADLISEVLFDAQLDWFETTGRLKCASEAPLNFPPWSSYQGLRFGYLGDEAWVIRGLGGLAVHDTPAFRDRAELISTKSAYLWAAVRAHPWCDLLRDKTRIEGLGFSAGIFAGTMEGMPGYTDLNTNGIILTAIGHALR